MKVSDTTEVATLASSAVPLSGFQHEIERFLCRSPRLYNGVADEGSAAAASS